MWQRIQEGFGKFNPPIRVMGSAFWVAWITILYSDKMVVAEPAVAHSTTAQVFMVSTSVLSITLLLLGFFPQGVRKVVANFPSMFLAQILAAAATVAIGLSSGNQLLAACAAVIPGAATALLALRIGIVFSEIDTRNAIIALCFSLILGCLLFGFTMQLSDYFPAAPLIMASCMLPLGCVMLFIRPPDTNERFHIPSNEMPKGFKRLMAFTFLITFALCCVRGYYPEFTDASSLAASMAVVDLGLICVGAVSAILVASMPRNAAYGLFIYIVLLICTCGAFVLPIFGMDSIAMGVVGSVLFGVDLVALFALLSRISYRSGVSVIRSFGWGFGSAALGTTVGFYMGGSLFIFSDEPNFALVNMGIVALCAVGAVILLRRKDIVTLMQPVSIEEDELAFEGDGYDEQRCEYPTASEEALSDVNKLSHIDKTEVSPSVRSKAPFRYQCEYLADKYGLSARERDVFLLLARGRDAKTIADELFISFNTARTHIRNVYSKLDVHSRRELMSLVDKPLDETSDFSTT